MQRDDAEVLPGGVASDAGVADVFLAKGAKGVFPFAFGGLEELRDVFVVLLGLGEVDRDLQRRGRGERGDVGDVFLNLSKGDVVVGDPLAVKIIGRQGGRTVVIGVDLGGRRIIKKIKNV